MSWIARFVGATVALVLLTAMVGSAIGGPLVSSDAQFAWFFLSLLGTAALVASAPALMRLAARDAAPAPPAVAAAPPAAAPTGAAGRLSDLQQRAKERDDAHKAEIRAHAERAVAPLTDAGRAAIEAALSAHVAIRHVFPPRLPQRGLSYLGGMPIVPDEFDWPMVHNRQGLLERLTFVAQIDLSDLPPPPAPGLRLLPPSGVLYLFAPLSGTFDASAHHAVARYLPGPVNRRWTPHEYPFVGAMEPADALARVWPGKRTRFDRVEVAFGWIAEPTDAEVEARKDEGFPHVVADRIRAERLDDFFVRSLALAPPSGPLPVAANATPAAPPTSPSGPAWPYPASMAQALAASDPSGGADPWHGFPHSWGAARVLRRFVDAWHRDALAEVEAQLTGPAEGADSGRLQGARDELRRLGRTISEAFFPTQHAGRSDVEAPPDEDQRRIRALLEALRGVEPVSARPRARLASQIPAWVAAAATAGAEAGLADPAGAAHVPAALTAALARRHATRAHRIFGQGDVVQTAADDMRDRYLLLLQLGRDDALGWWPGEMGPLQYWITPEDLAARRFENTVLTIEAY